MNVERREQLLSMAESLYLKLYKIEVRPLRARRGVQSDVTYGIPSSCVSQLTAFLRMHPTESFQQFLDGLHKLDALTSQNFENPKTHYRVLQQQVRQLITKNPDLKTEEYLFVLSWVRRLLPSKTDKEEPAKSLVIRSRSETPAKVETHRLRVTRDPGSGELRATLPNGGQAKEYGEEARKLMEHLPADIVARFKTKSGRKRGVLFDVTIEERGASWKIAKLEPPKDDLGG